MGMYMLMTMPDNGCLRLDMVVQCEVVSPKGKVLKCETWKMQATANT